MKRNKTLYFESAGGFNPTEYGEMNSCRIRTAFSIKNGKRVYFEAHRWTPSKEQVKYWNANPEKVDAMTLGKSYACVDMFYITDEIDANGYNVDDCNAHRIKTNERKYLIEWTKAAFVEFVNSFGANFSGIEVLPDLAGYRVFADVKDYHHGNTSHYNYGDEFNYNHEQTTRRIAKCEEIRQQDRAKTGERFPSFSFYVDDKDPNYCIYFAPYVGVPDNERRKRYYIPA